jgi:hypothetical protein
MLVAIVEPASAPHNDLTYLQQRTIMRTAALLLTAAVALCGCSAPPSPLENQAAAIARDGIRAPELLDLLKKTPGLGSALKGRELAIAGKAVVHEDEKTLSLMIVFFPDDMKPDDDNSRMIGGGDIGDRDRVPFSLATTFTKTPVIFRIRCVFQKYDAQGGYFLLHDVRYIDSRK